MAITPNREADFHFAMICNGYAQNGSYQPELAKQQFAGQRPDYFSARRVNFFGPNSQDHFFFLSNAGLGRMRAAFSSTESLDLIHKYNAIDPAQAARLAFTLGGLARYSEAQRTSRARAAILQFFPGQGNQPYESITNATGFVARMTQLADPKSAEAVASAMSMCIISGGRKGNGKSEGDVFRMADAVSQDPVEPKNTAQLGLSQLARLKIFQERNGYQVSKQIDKLKEPVAVFDEVKFPTVGAEFHLPMDIVEDSPDIWQRLALANMSQDQPGSSIQYSRKDKRVLEVRMNPSYYPIAVATWQHLTRLIPELDQAYFTATVNRNNPSAGANFTWERDRNLLQTIRAVGMLTYAGVYSAVPPTSISAEIPFGGVYLGQTVKLDQGQFSFTGNWAGGGEGQSGQMGVYAGYGKNFPILTKFLSMALACPNEFRSAGQGMLQKVRTLSDALALSSEERQLFFTTLRSRIERNPDLRKVVEAEANIQKVLAGT